MTGIAGASAADIGTAQTQTDNNSAVQEKVNTQTNSTDSVNESTTTQNSADENAQTVEKTDNDTVNTSTNSTATGTVNSTSSTSQNTENAQNTAQKPEAAAGETKTTSTNQTTVTSTGFTTAQIKDAAARVKSYTETNHKLPDYVTIGTTQVKMHDFLKLLAAGLVQLNSKTTNSITLKTVNAPKKPSENIKSGKINKAGYLDLAKRVNAFIDANGVLPNYVTSALGKLRYESLIYMYSKIFSFYKTHNRLPSYVTVKAWSTVGTSSTTGTNVTGTSSTSVPASLQQYLKATRNAQSNDPKIKALAASITSGSTSTYNKAAKIFNWVRDNLSYSFYYNTRYGAVGALARKTGNCVDTAHLVVALERAAGIPARYVNANAKFTSGNWYGHVWAQVWVSGKWYVADATSSRNSFGVVKNWTSATILGIYASLSF